MESKPGNEKMRRLIKDLSFLLLLTTVGGGTLVFFDWLLSTLMF